MHEWEMDSFQERKNHEKTGISVIIFCFAFSCFSGCLTAPAKEDANDYEVTGSSVLGQI